MPVFQRVKIERFKEILLNQSSGLVSDGGFSTYTLDDPSITPNGTGDFLGVIKTAVLLAEVYEDTMDTRNISLAQFNNLTQQQFDDAIRQGTILLNRNNNFQSKRIGWVEIGRTRASFYYETCDNSSKRPVSEHYYDLSQIQFDNKIVLGEGSEVEPTEALSQIGGFDPNWTNNTGIFAPGFNPIPLSEYVKFAAFNNGMIQNSMGDMRQINPLGLTDDSRPIRINLLMANRTDHFDNQYATEITPGKWGMVRSTIEEGFRPGIHMVYNQLGLGVNQQQSSTIDFSVNFGSCLSLGYTLTTVGGSVRTGGRTTTTTPETGGPMRPPDVLVPEDVFFPFDGGTTIPFDWGKIGDVDRRVKVTRDYMNKTCFSLIHDFPNSLKEKLILLQNSIDLNQLSGMSSAGNIIDGIIADLDYTFYASRLRYLLMSLIRGEIPYFGSDMPDLMDTVDVPRGTIRKEVNPNTGCIELTYIGTPNGDYVGPQILTPSAFSFDPSMDEPTPLILNLGDVRVDRRGKSTQRFSDAELYWMKRRGSSLNAMGGRGWWDMHSTGYAGQSRIASSDYAQLFELVEDEKPIYIFASDQKWEYGRRETKSVKISNRGGTRMIITDYTPRGCANFVNISLLNALPIVLNPLEEIEFLVEYSPTISGLQSWKGKNDPFPALLSDIEPDNFILIEYQVYFEIPQLGYLPFEAIPEDPRPANRWSFSKRNKNWSKLEIIKTATGT